MRNMLIDNPEPVAARRDDEAIVQLPERAEIRQSSERVDTIPIRRELVESAVGVGNMPNFCCGRSRREVIWDFSRTRCGTDSNFRNFFGLNGSRRFDGLRLE